MKKKSRLTAAQSYSTTTALYFMEPQNFSSFQQSKQSEYFPKIEKLWYFKLLID